MIREVKSLRWPTAFTACKQFDLEARCSKIQFGLRLDFVYTWYKFSRIIAACKTDRSTHLSVNESIWNHMKAQSEKRGSLAMHWQDLVNMTPGPGQMGPVACDSVLFHTYEILCTYGLCNSTQYITVLPRKLSFFVKLWVDRCRRNWAEATVPSSATMSKCIEVWHTHTGPTTTYVQDVATRAETSHQIINSWIAKLALLSQFSFLVLVLARHILHHFAICIADSC